MILSTLIDLYLEGDPQRQWHGARAEYPLRPGGRTTEAQNMAYALRDLRETIIDLPPGDPQATRSGPIAASRHLADLTPEAVKPSDLRAVQRHMIRRGLCRNQVNARKNRILRFFRWCVAYEHCAQIVVDRLLNVTPVKPHHLGVRETPKVRSVDEARVLATMACARPELRRAIEVQNLSAMRPGELVAMRVCDLHPGRGANGDPIWHYLPAWHKTAGRGVSRVIPIGPIGQMLLREQVSACLAQGELGAGEARLPRLGDAGDPRRIWSWRTVAGYYQAVVKAARRAGVEHWHPNQLRHARITFAAHTRGEQIAQAIAGHTDAATTRRHYIDADRVGASLFAQDFG